MKLLFKIILLLLFNLNGFIMLSIEVPTYKSKYEQGKLIIKFKKSVYTDYANVIRNNEQLKSVFEYIDAYQIRKVFPKHNKLFNKFDENGNKLIDLSLIYEVNYNNNVPLNKLIADFMNTGLFEYVQPHFFPELLYMANDPLHTSQYYLTNVMAYEAWDSCRGDTNIVIGIVDTGVDIDHEDLINDIKYNYNDPINGIDDDNDGFIDNYRGWDLGENDNNPQSNINPHGVKVAGIAAATTDNNIGISGTGFNTRFLPVKISDENGDLTQAYEGIVYAADHGCTVINCSWGGVGMSLYGQDIINYATFNRNTLVVAAAGNSNNDSLLYPASYDNVISVAGTDINDVKWTGSSYGYKVDLSAPGDNIYFTKNDNQYGHGWGTSYASPIVAAAAALVHKKYPQLSALQIGEVLKITTDNIDTIDANSIYSEKLGTGRLNIYRAITDSLKPSIYINNISLEGSSPYFISDDTINIEGEIINYLSQSSNLQVSLTTQNNDIEIINSNYNIGVVNTNESVTIPSDYFKFLIGENLQYDTTVLFKFTYNDGSYHAFQYFEETINKSYYNLNYNNISTTITANGRIGYNNYGKNGNGFIYKNVGNFLFEGGFIIATSSNTVLDNLYGNHDFEVVNRVDSIFYENTNLLKLLSLFNDDNATNNKIDIEVLQNVYASNNEGNKDYLIFDMKIVNKKMINISNLYAGLYVDWDIMGSSNDKTSYDEDLKLAYSWNVLNPVYYSGIQVLNNGSANSYAFDNVTGGNGGIDIQDGFSKEEKYFAMTNSRLNAGENNNGNDIASLLSTGPYNILAGDTLNLAFALLAGDNLFEIKKSAVLAKQNYDDYISTINQNVNNIKEDIKVFPNPVTNGYINFSNMKKDANIRLLDTYGNILLEKTYDDFGEVRLNISKCKTGFYFLVITTNTRTVNKKILIIH